MSGRRIKLFLEEWFNVSLSTGIINQCIREAGRAVAPLQDELIQDLLASNILFADETGWKQSGNKTWLWVFLNYTTALFIVGSRSKDTAHEILSRFSGILMSDGYHVYRFFEDRLRCWAHLIRKCKGLHDSRHMTAHQFGLQSMGLFNKLMLSIKVARDGPLSNLVDEHQQDILGFKELCLQYKDSSHDKLRALAREFLNDWDAIWRVLEDVTLPMTNNEAERALRHWVINRLISHGTRSDEGSVALATLASVIETCRLRQVSPWKYIACVISERRKNNSAPPLPQSIAA